MRPWMLAGTVFMFTWVSWVSRGLRADEAAPTAGASRPVSTLGGKQFWADRRLFHGWRIQQCVLTGHCRLLDERNRRHASGTFEQCAERLEAIKREQNLAPMRGRVVLLLHGLFRTRGSLCTLGQHLEEQGGYQVYYIGYPTTRAEVGWHAKHLGEVLAGFPEVDEINFVAHSLGNLVIRHYLADHTNESHVHDDRPQGARLHTAVPQRRALREPGHTAAAGVGRPVDAGGLDRKHRESPGLGRGRHAAPKGAQDVSQGRKPLDPRQQSGLTALEGRQTTSR